MFITHDNTLQSLMKCFVILIANNKNSFICLFIVFFMDGNLRPFYYVLLYNRSSREFFCFEKKSLMHPNNLSQTENSLKRLIIPHALRNICILKNVKSFGCMIPKGILEFVV